MRNISGLRSVLGSLLLLAATHASYGQNTCPLSGNVTVNFDDIAVATERRMA